MGMELESGLVINFDYFIKGKSNIYFYFSINVGPIPVLPGIYHALILRINPN